jgi:actin-like ATPase involved in cell morphogenesis
METRLHAAGRKVSIGGAGVSWVLAIDFGTSFSSAAVSVDGREPRLVEVQDIDGKLQGRMPSAVFAPPNTDELVVGWRAEDQGMYDPKFLQRTPKEKLGEQPPFFLLGQREVPKSRAVAELLLDFVRAAGDTMGGSEPDKVRLTHPASWREDGPKRAALERAAEEAGLDEPLFMKEPVAAAVHFAFHPDHAELEPGQLVAVYDLGGGTFDAAVLRMVEGPEQFEVVGRALGKDGLGGEAFDDSFEDFLGEEMARASPEEWEKIQASPRLLLMFRRQVRRAKEALSHQLTWTVRVPESERSLTVTREQFEDEILDQVVRSVEILEKTITDGAKLHVEQLAAIYLAGGSSRIPLVSKTIHERLGLDPVPLAEPKSAIALGAAKARLDGTRLARHLGEASRGITPLDDGLGSGDIDRSFPDRRMGQPRDHREAEAALTPEDSAADFEVEDLDEDPDEFDVEDLQYEEWPKWAWDAAMVQVEKLDPATAGLLAEVERSSLQGDDQALIVRMPAEWLQRWSADPRHQALLLETVRQVTRGRRTVRLEEAQFRGDRSMLNVYEKNFSGGSDYCLCALHGYLSVGPGGLEPTFETGPRQVARMLRLGSVGQATVLVFVTRRPGLYIVEGKTPNCDKLRRGWIYPGRVPKVVRLPRASDSKDLSQFRFALSVREVQTGGSSVHSEKTRRGVLSFPFEQAANDFVRTLEQVGITVD